MAAGRVDVLRREVYYFKKESSRYRKGYSDRDSSQGRDKRRNGFDSGATETCAWRNRSGRGGESVDNSRASELGKSSGPRFWDDNCAYRSRDDGNGKDEDGVSRPPEKKRKISPILWDRDDKQVSHYSKDKMAQKANPLCSVPTLLQSFVTNVGVDGNITKNCVTTTELQDIQISSVTSHDAAGSEEDYELPVNSTSLFLSEENRRNDVDMEQVEDYESVNVRHISASRWAYNEDSPGAIYLENSPESGEFRREYSEVSWGKSSSSNGEDIIIESASKGDHLERGMHEDDCMEHDEMCEDAGGSYLDSDIDEELQEPAAAKSGILNMLQGCRSVFDYEKLRKINEGTYGVVYKARDKRTDEIMALKKVKMEQERDGFPMSALREINILLSLHHPSVVNVKEVVMDDRDDGCGDVFMVMEYIEHDLKWLIEAMKQPFSEKEVKCLMLQLLEGVKYLHDNWILHRDLKTSNILLSSSGKLKICDFGMSRQYGCPARSYTPLVVTLWYRAPELLLGTKQYSTALDMWSVGCIMAELLTKQPLFSGRTEFDLLHKITNILGSPNETIWPGFSELPGARLKFAKQPRSALREKFPAVSFKGSPVLSDHGFDLLSQLLTYDPEKRITAEAALRHRWFHLESDQELVAVQESLAKRLRSMARG